jgi:hypothetical protein
VAGSAPGKQAHYWCHLCQNEFACRKGMVNWNTATPQVALFQSNIGMGKKKAQKRQPHPLRIRWRIHQGAVWMGGRMILKKTIQ